MGDTSGGTPGNRLKILFGRVPGALTGVAALVTAVAALAGLFWPRDGGDGGSGPGQTPGGTQQQEAEIVVPQPGRVDRQTRVQIRYAGLRPDSDLWIVERAGDLYFPQPRCPGEQPTVPREPGVRSGPWDGQIEVGTADSASGTPYELILLLTTEPATRLLSERIRGWCDPATPWPGIAQLPREDAEVTHRVTVFR